MDSRLEDDMGVNVGDTIVNHHYPKPDPMQQAPVVVQSETSSIPTWFLASVLVCALLGAGALAWLAFKPSDQQQPTQPPPVFDVIVAE